MRFTGTSTLSILDARNFSAPGKWEGQPIPDCSMAGVEARTKRCRCDRSSAETEDIQEFNCARSRSAVPASDDIGYEVCR